MEDKMTQTNIEIEDEEFECEPREAFLTKKILDAQMFLERNQTHINPVVYTELMFILCKHHISTIEELEEICERHRN